VKQGTGASASLAAIASSVASLACCLPFGFVGALGAAGAGALFDVARPWLWALSIALLALGFWQQHRATQCNAKGRTLGRALLCVAAAVVTGMILFPQQIAGFIADRLAWP